MSLSLCDPLDVAQLGARGSRIRQTLSLGQMPRLVEALPAQGNASMKIDCDLSFEQDEAGRVVVRGSLVTRWTLTCQRCLDAVPEDIDIAVRWRSGGLPDGDFELGDEPVRLVEWAEDELLLHLPPVPAHAQLEQCAEWARQHLHSPEKNETVRTPFAGLKELLDGQDN